MSGEFDQAKGRIKQAAGDLTGNKDLEHEGERDEAAGKLKDKVDEVAGKVEDKVDDAIDAVKKKAS